VEDSLSPNAFRGKPFFNTLVILALRRWIDIDLDKATEPFVEQVVMA
jgi:hypothetical protein